MMTMTGRQSLDTTHTAPSTIIAYGVLFLLFIYYMLQYLDFPVLPVSELCWNALVYITPPRLIKFLHPSTNLASQQQEGDQSASTSIGYARKSEAMRHILGLDGTGIMSGVQRARTVPGIKAIMKKTVTGAPPGLGNWDNSCYQNSILQGLAALHSLPSYLEYGMESGAQLSTKAALRDLLKRLNDPASAGGKYWTPAVLKSMSSWQQQDAQEYFSKVLDEVDKETSKSLEAMPRNTGLVALVESKGEPRNLGPKALSKTYEAPERLNNVAQSPKLPNELASIMARNPLEGLLAQRVGCLRCGYVEGLSMIPFNCLTVPLGRQWMYDIRSCLDEYTGLESIHGVECAKCTLLYTKQQLERLLSQIQAQVPQDDASSTIQMLKALKESSTERLAAVNTALEEEDFSDNTLLKKCQINAKSRVSTTKTRQAVVARAPKALAIHVNRSVFDEVTGAQMKNPADVRFPHRFDFSPWCLGGGLPLVPGGQEMESWNIDPAASMLSPEYEDMPSYLQKVYELRAVVTHYGRHENGHYICYRRFPVFDTSEPGNTQQPAERWWRLSDDEVSEVTEGNVFAQGGVFMLFYEQVQQPNPSRDIEKNDVAMSEDETAVNAQESEESVTEILHLPHESTKEMTEIEQPPNPANTTLLPISLNTSETQKHIVTDTMENTLDAPTELDPDMSKTPASEFNSETLSNAEHDPPTNTPSKSEHTDPIDEASAGETKAITSPAARRIDPDTPSSDTLSPSMPDTAIREPRQTAPTMRTAGPRNSRGSASRSSKGMGQVSSMVTAN